MMIRKENKRFGFKIALIVIVAAMFALSGCTIRTQSGTEYKILDQQGQQQPDDSVVPQDDTEKTDSTEKNPFGDLTRSEQEDLAMKEVEPKKPATMAPKPKEDDLEPERPKDSFPTRITGKPKATLPVQTQLYPVPASAEVLLFDPEKKHRSNRKAALDLTNQGRSALASGKVELAISKFQKAISIDSKCGHAYFYFARARFVQKDWDQVVALTEKATLHLSKDSVYLSRTHLLKAQALANQKRYVPAMAACESSIDADGTNVQAKLLRNRLRNLY